MESVKEHKGVLSKPKPFVTFEDFGDSALIFKLKFFVKDSFRVPTLSSDIRFLIDKLFRENNITIPFPDRKSTRLNSSHVVISYAVFCLKKKKLIQYYCTSELQLMS